ncbi:MAG: hypothetical protein ACJATS_002424 [Psychroserpens sp.]|jgi:hypothetical protein
MKSIFPVLLVFALVMVASVALAQAPPPASNPPGAPLDGMVTALLAASVGYGFYKSKNAKADVK